ncbi:alpha/beta hydrolase [Achromobacter xylosoxidans]|uniref:alpha/beta hydrolase n=1 Tax=Alcaligenes xylosoxydans xylosoxydans TaxID=85698 RepID=UPI00203E9C7F|nr:alpha/beta hydrolase [Achromobacter xylosoxidans]MCM2573330.1 alpha/beta hydrolase [Achromobacter xylosoxidans]
MTTENKLSAVAAADTGAARKPRKKPFLASAIGAVFGFAGTVAPGATAKVVQKLLFTPTRLKPSEPGRSVLAQARAEPHEIDGQTVYYYVWGDSGPRVLLVHGWGGDAAQMTAYVEPLRQRGCQVVAIDMPAHGRSTGKQASVRHFEPCVAHAAQAYGPFHGVIAHSLGAAAVTFALSRGFTVERAVFLGPVSRYDSVWEYSRRMMNLPPKVMPLVLKRAQDWLGITFPEMEPARLAPSMTTPLLIVHDRADRESPYEDAAVLAQTWPGAELVATEKMGHTRALRDPALVAQVAAFAAQ